MSHDGGVSVLLRRERTAAAVGRLAAAVEAWLTTWDHETGPQASQITRCGEMLRGLVTQLGVVARDLPTDARAHPACRALDSDLAVVDRLWRLFAERFDQRRDPARKPILLAADDLIWSCAQQTVLLADQPLPLPLAYLEPAYSASATPRTRPPESLPVIDRQISAAMAVWPVPMIALPLSVIDEPWWLALVAHEVGHHVQYDLDAAALTTTKQTLKAAASVGWTAWAEEIFADAFSVAAIGPVAIAAIAELEWDSPDVMAESRAKYPPAMVRLALMAEVAHALGFSDVALRADTWQPVVDGMVGGDRVDVAAKLAKTPAVAQALLAMPLGKRTLATLPDRVKPPLPGPMTQIGLTRDAPRLVTAQLFERYRALAKIAPAADREQARAALRDRSAAAISAVGDKLTTKRSSHTTADNTTAVERVFQAVREAEREPAP